MKIALIVEYLHERGGTQRQAVELARCLQNDGHEITIFSKQFVQHRCFPEINHQLKVLSITKTETSNNRKHTENRFWQKATNSLRGMHERFGSNYLSAFKLIVSSSASLVELVQKEHQKTRFDLVNSHDFGAAAWAASAISKILKIPSVWQCNDPLLKWENKTPWTARPFKQWLITEDRRRVSNINRITVLDNTMETVVHRRYGKQPVVVRSGVDLARFGKLPDKTDARQKLGLPKDKTVIFVLALLNSAHRRIEDVVEAHALCPNDVWLLLAAPKVAGGYCSLVEEKIRKSSAENRIRWISNELADDKQLSELFGASDIFVYPNTHQTWGLAVIEAAACGLPVVISDGAGAHEVFVDGENGIVFRGGSSNSLFEKMLPLVKDTRLRCAIGKNGQAMVRGRFSWEKYADAMLEIFETETSSYRTIG
ncbi:MAG: glycosyltransferase family 4 protein [Pseudomonadota bacterium]